MSAAEMRDSAGKFCENLSKKKKKKRSSREKKPDWALRSDSDGAESEISLTLIQEVTELKKRFFKRNLFCCRHPERRLCGAQSSVTTLITPALLPLCFVGEVFFLVCFFLVTAKSSSKSYISEYIMSSDNIIRGKKMNKTFYVHWGGFNSSSDHLFISFM